MELETMVIEGVIFDMDGLMIDSEPLWHIAERECFGAVGVSLTMEQLLENTGLRVDEVVAKVYARTPWRGLPCDEVVARIVARMVQLLREKPKPMDGLRHALDFFHARGLPMAVASSSAMPILDAALDGLQVRHYFKAVRSAQGLPYGKPHPGVYLEAAEALKVEPTRCLALEDSLTGVLSAKSARMTCICVPEAVARADPRFAIADVKLSSLHEIDEALFARLGGAALHREKDSPERERERAAEEAPPSKKPKV